MTKWNKGVGNAIPPERHVAAWALGVRPGADVPLAIVGKPRRGDRRSYLPFGYAGLAGELSAPGLSASMDANSSGLSVRSQAVTLSRIVSGRRAEGMGMTLPACAKHHAERDYVRRRSPSFGDRRNRRLAVFQGRRSDLTAEGRPRQEGNSFRLTHLGQRQCPPPRRPRLFSTASTSTIVRAVANWRRPGWTPRPSGSCLRLEGRLARPTESSTGTAGSGAWSMYRPRLSTPRARNEVSHDHRRFSGRPSCTYGLSSVRRFPLADHENVIGVPRPRVESLGY